MTDRHQELRRQYDLLREHLAWLEKEMARERMESPVRPAMVPSAPPSIAPVTPAEDPDALLNSYAAEERHDPESAKRGCLLVFAIALGLLGLSVTATYFLFYAHR